MRLYGIRIANLALFALCSFLTASVFNEIAAEMLIPVRTATAQSVALGVSRAPSWSEREVVVERNLFGSKLTSSAPPPAPLLDEVDLEETELPVTLLGTVAGNNPALSTAAISDTSLRTHQILRVGDFLEGRDDVRVTAIERMRVVLQNGLRLEELLLDEEAPRAVSAPRAAGPQRPIRRRRAQASKPGEQSRAARSAEVLEQRVRDLESELSGGSDIAAQMATIMGSDKPTKRAAPKKSSPGNSAAVAEIFSKANLAKGEDGGIEGLEFSGIDMNGILAQQGLLDGDIVTEVNGMPIDSVAATSRIMSEFTTVQDLNVKVKGPNGVRTILVPAAEVAKYLR